MISEDFEEVPRLMLYTSLHLPQRVRDLSFRSVPHTAVLCLSIKKLEVGGEDVETA
jgi:hypothetical protein